MALRQTVIAAKLRKMHGEMESLESAKEALRARREDLEKRDQETEAALNEVNDNTPAEDVQAVEEQVDALLQEDKDLQAEETENETKRNTLQQQIEQLQNELEELNSRAKEAEKADKPGFSMQKREDKNKMETRKFFKMTMQERDAFFAREDVKTFVERARELGKQGRSVSGAELLVPDVVLGLIRENIGEYSKLYRHVNVRNVPGNGRQLVTGAIPEAVWTEMCGALNELDLRFTQVEVNGYKVGGYIAVCNALLEDSDIALGAEIMAALAQAIGLALDKAILYGTGTKMPMGIVTRLAQTVDPGTGSEGTRPWENLSATHLVKLTAGLEDLKLFKAIIKGAGVAVGKYSTGTKFWAMNEKTKANLMANAISFNAAGAIVAGVSAQMPIIGGEIVELSFIPDNVVIGGYGDMYLLAERAGTAIEQSEHVRFIEDQTVFRGRARYDGVPVVPEAFVVMDIAGGTINAKAVTFVEDKANAVAGA